MDMEGDGGGQQVGLGVHDTRDNREGGGLSSSNHYEC